MIPFGSMRLTASFIYGFFTLTVPGIPREVTVPLFGHETGLN